MNLKNTVNVTVNINQFSTDALITELYNRIDDHLNDPEPKHDPTLEGMTANELHNIASTLVNHK